MIPIQSNAIELFKDWDKEDKVLYGIFSTMQLIDYMQTRDIFDSSDYYELNPIINWTVERMGEDRGIAVFFISSLVINYLVADYLKDNNRRLFLTGINLFEFGVIVRNHYIGIGWKF